MRLPATLARLRRDRRGAMVIETAIVAPVLVLMSLGAFQVSQLVARQSELQSALAEASAIALTSPPETEAQRTVLKNVIVASTGLAADKVTISEAFRCGSDTAYVAAEADCVGVKVSTFVKIELDDTFTPTWTELGFGRPVVFSVDGYVMVKQS